MIAIEELKLTTKLDGGDTFFLPFSLGHNHGKGNPQHPFGHHLSAGFVIPRNLAADF